MYRCKTCKNRTEDIDDVPCNPPNHEFRPEKIRTLHKFNYDLKNRTITVLCTGQPPKAGTQGLGGNYGINCIRCRTIMKENREREIAQQSPSFQGNGVQGSELAQTENTGTLPAEE